MERQERMVAQQRAMMERIEANSLGVVVPRLVSTPSTGAQDFELLRKQAENTIQERLDRDRTPGARGRLALEAAEKACSPIEQTRRENDWKVFCDAEVQKNKRDLRAGKSPTLCRQRSGEHKLALSETRKAEWRAKELAPLEEMKEAVANKNAAIEQLRESQPRSDNGAFY